MSDKRLFVDTLFVQALLNHGIILVLLTGNGRKNNRFWRWDWRNVLQNVPVPQLSAKLWAKPTPNTVLSYENGIDPAPGGKFATFTPRRSVGLAPARGVVAAVLGGCPISVRIFLLGVHMAPCVEQSSEWQMRPIRTADRV